MKITHYCNSFISVDFPNSKIACDPWMGTTRDNAWISYPINDESVLDKINPNYIYISHLHPDHFDPKALKKFHNKDSKIIIKKFSDGRLKKRINNLGYKNILECNPWEEYVINKDFSVVIVPQMSSNTDSLPEDINYDLDTSILIISKSNSKIFYNNVDNPTSNEDMKKLNDFAVKKLNGKINVACLPVGAASEYPQCFLGIDREKEKEKIIDKSHINLKKKLTTLNPDLFFPAGGTYFIYGKFSKLNKYIAQPHLNDTIDLVKKELKIDSCIIEGGKSIIYKNNNWEFFDEKLNINLFLSKEDCIKKKGEMLYQYEISDDKKNLELLDNYFNIAKENYIKAMKTKFVNIKWIIKFYVYKNIDLKQNGDLDEKNVPLKTYEISSSNKTDSSEQTLKCHLDHSLFESLLTKKTIWNVALSGSLILFERKPNKFIPNVTFSLNYLSC